MNTNEGGSKTVALMDQKPLDFIHEVTNRSIELSGISFITSTASPQIILFMYFSIFILQKYLFYLDRTKLFFYHVTVNPNWLQRFSIWGVGRFEMPNFQFTMLFIYIHNIQFNYLLPNDLYILLALVILQYIQLFFNIFLCLCFSIIITFKS